jgi:hypothetical protein
MKRGSIFLRSGKFLEKQKGTRETHSLCLPLSLETKKPLWLTAQQRPTRLDDSMDHSAQNNSIESPRIPCARCSLRILFLTIFKASLLCPADKKRTGSAAGIATGSSRPSPCRKTGRSARTKALTLENIA